MTEIFRNQALGSRDDDSRDSRDHVDCNVFVVGVRLEEMLDRAVAGTDLEYLEPLLLRVFFEKVRDSEALGEAQIHAVGVGASFHGVRQATDRGLDREVADRVQEE